ncbi:trafficking protein particle complex subunit 1 [Adelges cooleyi]|uniref:trafficking protein particle complex subunit 1 n=1 Tax=Adelges cooleyi TaxID=133065 RepID=UPI00217F2929|nr:trafficking protein particle complex subunit 1 [Adelges cooleyi]XP_050430346.1 trafficking protein particle complex subunit 1 [Adelges cooleyi]
MSIHNIYIFDRMGTLLYYMDWNRQKNSGMSKEEEAKLMYGMLFSIKSFVAKISPHDPKRGFLCYKTNKYALHYYESLTGIKFVLNTNTSVKNVRDLLQQLYKDIYVEYVVKNTECEMGQPIVSELFKVKLDQFIKQQVKTLQ